MNICDLPNELLIKILEYLVPVDMLSVFQVNEDLYDLSLLEDLWENLCKVYPWIEVSEKPQDMSFREYFSKKYFMIRRVSFLFTSFYPSTKESVVEGLIRVFPSSSFQVDFVNIHQSSTTCYSVTHSEEFEKLYEDRKVSKEDVCEIMRETDVILVFGGNVMRTIPRVELGNFLHDEILYSDKRKKRQGRKKSVLVLMWAHGDGGAGWQIAGKWIDNKMNPLACGGATVDSKNSMFTSYNNNNMVQKIFFENYEEEVDFFKSFNPEMVFQTLEVSKEETKGRMDRENSRVLLDFLDAEGKKVISHAVGERKDVKVLQLNFSLNNTSIDTVCRLIKYIHLRRERV